MCLKPTFLQASVNQLKVITTSNHPIFHSFLSTKTKQHHKSGVEQYIRDKYDRKKWFNASAAANTTSSPTSNQSNNPNSRQGMTPEEEQRRRERRERKRQQKLQQQQLQQQQQQQQQPAVQLIQTQPQVPPQAQAQTQAQNNNNFFAGFSSPQSSSASIPGFSDFQSSGFVTPAQQQQGQSQQPVQQSPQSNFFANCK